MKLNIKFLLLIFILSVVSTHGQNWYTLNPNTQWDVTAVSFIDDLTGYIGGGVWTGPQGPNLTFLKRTTNGGQSFTTVFDGSSDTPICQMHFFTNQRGIFHRWQDNVQKTIDGGANEFSLLSTGSASSDARFQVLDSLRIFYFGHGLNEIYYTSDGGQNWAQLNTLTNNGNVGSFMNPDTGFYSPQNSVVYRTFDSGMTWTNVLTGSPVIGMQCLQDSIVLLFSPNEIKRSTDLGTTWNTVYFSPQNVLNCDVKDNLVVVCGTGGLVAKSHDYGATWISDFPPTTETLLDICITDVLHDSWYVVGNNNTMFRHLDLTTNIEVPKDEFKIFCFPNPSSGIFEVKSNLNVQSIEVFNLLCEKIFFENYTDSNSSSKTIRLNADPGIYFLEVKNQEHSFIEKIIVN